MEVVAARGLTEDVVGSATDATPLLHALHCGARYGSLVFCAEEWQGNEHGLPTATGDLAWTSADLLLADVVDAAGELRAVLSLSGPVSGLRPAPHELLRCSDELQQPLSALLVVVENELITSQHRVGRAMRELARDLDRRITPEQLVEIIRDELTGPFRADRSFVNLVGDGEEPPVGVVGVSGALHEDISGALVRALRNRDVVMMENGRVWGEDAITARHAEEVERLTGSPDQTTMVLVPIGIDNRLLGVFTICRSARQPRWTESESHGAVEVGRDLARVVLNVQAMSRHERVLRELELLDTRRSQLIATIAHELKNPIGVIRGHVELAQTAEGDDVPRSLAVIDRGAKRLEMLADDLLVFSKADSIDRPVSRELVDVGALAREAVEFAQVTADRAGVDLDLVVEGVVTVLGDHEALSLVITNLLSNAVKYCDAGDEVTLAVRRIRGSVVLTCRDTGIGISENDQEQLFAEFFRSTNPAAFNRPGTGLGLAILQRVVGRHGGKVDVRSRLGEGTSFVVTLPVATRDVVEAARGEASSLVAAVRSRGQASTLVVE
ncbi:sensor histidine kinase [Nocardioides yefusunii]|uniref:histidine kinase n=1 Tax=Nocardioides yefusunii TaxID=2500546 RepID=A0ABW1QZK2_9ACTN|nr:GAF domain-containing sensor histidine kinase [Nocardioides yefusunii]